MKDLLITGARIIDPASGRDEVGDLAIRNGLFCPADEADGQREPIRIDGAGCIAAPGFIDLYARLREPGLSRKGTIASEAAAAVNAGFTSVLCTPDTQPVIDSTATVQWIAERALQAGAARVLPMAALTAGLEGEQLAELGTLKAAGCVAASQADRPVTSTRVLMRAMEYAASFEVPLILTPLDRSLAGDGCAHAGALAARLGLPGISVAAETIATARLLELCRTIDCPLHLARLSSARAVEMVNEAKQAGLPVTASVGIHHLYFTDEQLAGYDDRFLSAVPFRSPRDRQALREAVRNGVIDAICSDHAPHDTDARLAPFPAAEPGLSAYDRFMPLLLALESKLDMPLHELLARVTTGPAALLRTLPGERSSGTLQTGQVADLVLIDPASTATNDAGHWRSHGRNSPLLGAAELAGISDEAVALRGSLRLSLVAGEIRTSTST